MRRPAVREVLPQAIWRRYAEVLRQEGPVEELSMERLHALRIRLKHVRYLIENFRECLAPEAAEFVKEVRALQDTLGALHDLHFQAEQLQALQGELPARFQEPARRLEARIRGKMQRRRRDLAPAWARFSQYELKRMLGLALAAL
jgi:CHAD domain-containing protein